MVNDDWIMSMSNQKKYTVPTIDDVVSFSLLIKTNLLLIHNGKSIMYKHQ